MRRLLTKHWKGITYLVGFVLLAFTPFEATQTAYGLVGVAWLVVFILRNNDGSTVQDQDLSDSRGLHGQYSTYYHRH